MGRFSGKKIVITGASSGIGLAGAMRIIDEGGEVMLTGRHQQKLASLRTLLPERAWFLQNDGAKPEAAHALAESVESFGMLDGLWLNAAARLFYGGKYHRNAVRYHHGQQRPFPVCGGWRTAALIRAPSLFMRKGCCQ
ncbi:SDR family NAD(P)-dependent oxidoreductase [Klebsiella variicola]